VTVPRQCQTEETWEGIPNPRKLTTVQIRLRTVPNRCQEAPRGPPGVYPGTFLLSEYPVIPNHVCRGPTPTYRRICAIRPLCLSFGHALVPHQAGSHSPATEFRSNLFVTRINSESLFLLFITGSDQVTCQDQVSNNRCQLLLRYLQPRIL